MTEEPQYDTSGLSEEVLAKVAAGEYRISGPGMKENKPVVVDASTGRWVEGSGRPANANDPAMIGKVHGFKHSKGYAEALEQFIPAERDGSADAILSLQELIEAAKAMIVGMPEYDKVHCPECDHEFRVQVGVKRDSKVLTFLIERLVGAAQKTSEVNFHSEELLRVVSDNRVLHRIEVVSVTPEERAARIRLLREADE